MLSRRREVGQSQAVRTVSQTSGTRAVAMFDASAKVEIHAQTHGEKEFKMEEAGYDRW